MKYHKNYLGSLHYLSIIISPSEICCYEPVVVQSLLRLGGKSITLYLDADGSLNIDTFFSDYNTRENFCIIIDKIINSSISVIDSPSIAKSND